MTRAEVQAYLEEHIPLSAALGIEVQEADRTRVTIAAPLRPANVNHRSTAFGGSVAALAILTGWTQVHLRLADEAVDAQTVIQSSAVQYVAPVVGAFRAVSQPIGASEWARFMRGIVKHGKGRLQVDVHVLSDGETAATFRGAYVAIRQDS